MLNFFRKKAPERPLWDLRTPLFSWSPEDHFTIGAAVEGTAIFGATGGGKTSGSGACIAKSFLAHGFGGLVLTCKKDELELWTSYARATGRLDDLMVFGSGEPLRFNPLDFEATRAGEGAGHVENLVSLLLQVLEVADRGASGSGNKEGDTYWRNATKQLIRNLCDLSLMATGCVSIPTLNLLLATAPLSMDQAGMKSWQANSACYQALREADQRIHSPERRHDFDIVLGYFTRDFANLASKTRSVIVSTFSCMVDTLNRGLLRTLFCGGTNVTPDVVADGKILVINLPLKEFGDVGSIGQVLFKIAFQRAMERRNVTKNPRPVFLWIDEFQNLATSQDALFQSTARSSRVASVFITQNMPAVRAALGGRDGGQSAADALYGNLNCKIFHNNSEAHTNHWASEMVGRTLQSFGSSGHSPGEQDWISTAVGLPISGQVNAGLSDRFELELQPRAFSLLRTGGLDHGFLVDAVVYQNGKVFRSTGTNYLHATFAQTP